MCQSFKAYIFFFIDFTRSQGAIQARTASWGPFRPRLRPSRPSGAQAAANTPGGRNFVTNGRTKQRTNKALDIYMG